MTNQYHLHFASKISLSIGCSKVKNILSILYTVVVAKEVATRIFKTDKPLPRPYEKPVT
jgi:hypothetical protein